MKKLNSGWEHKLHKCTKCKAVKRGINFGLMKAGTTYLRPVCKECRREYDRARIASGKKKRQAYNADKYVWYRIKHRFGIDRTRYEAMWAKQQGKCAICGKTESEGHRFSIDHDHSCCPGRRGCGKCFRGILCLTCNSAIGHLNDDVSILSRAIKYLTQGVVNA